MKYIRVPSPGSWKRKVIGSVAVLVMLPLLPAIALMAASQVVTLVEHVLGLIWPWTAAISVLILLGRLVIGQHRR